MVNVIDFKKEEKKLQVQVEFVDDEEQQNEEDHGIRIEEKSMNDPGSSDQIELAKRQAKEKAQQVGADQQRRGNFFGTLKKKKLTDVLSDHSGENRGDQEEEAPVRIEPP